MKIHRISTKTSTFEKVVPTSPVAKPKISLDAVEVSAQLPEDGWFLGNEKIDDDGVGK